MINSREAILSALFARLSTITFLTPVRDKTTFVTTSRRLKHWAEVSKEDRPALFMTCHGESPSYSAENLPPRWSLRVTLYIYTDGSDASTVPDTDLSVILDAIDKSLSPGPAEQRLTLGGLVSHCRIDGEILREPGDMDGDGIMIVPITLMTT